MAVIFLFISLQAQSQEGSVDIFCGDRKYQISQKTIINGESEKARINCVDDFLGYVVLYVEMQDWPQPAFLNDKYIQVLKKDFENGKGWTFSQVGLLKSIDGDNEKIFNSNCGHYMLGVRILPEIDKRNTALYLFYNTPLVYKFSLSKESGLNEKEYTEVYNNDPSEPRTCEGFEISYDSMKNKVIVDYSKRSVYFIVNGVGGLQYFTF